VTGGAETPLSSSGSSSLLSSLELSDKKVYEPLKRAQVTSSPPAVERIWLTQVRQLQIMACPSREKSLNL